MTGYCNRPGQFPLKDAVGVGMELRTMVANGCRHLQVCTTQDVLRNPETPLFWGSWAKPVGVVGDVGGQLFR